MPIITNLAAEIEITAGKLVSTGRDISGVKLGRIEMNELKACTEPVYQNLIQSAIELRMPFYWHGFKIVPVDELHDFTFFA